MKNSRFTAGVGIACLATTLPVQALVIEQDALVIASAGTADDTAIVQALTAAGSNIADVTLKQVVFPTGFDSGLNMDVSGLAQFTAAEKISQTVPNLLDQDINAFSGGTAADPTLGVAISTGIAEDYGVPEGEPGKGFPDPIAQDPDRGFSFTGQTPVEVDAIALEGGDEILDFLQHVQPIVDHRDSNSGTPFFYDLTFLDLEVTVAPGNSRVSFNWVFGSEEWDAQDHDGGTSPFAADTFSAFVQDSSHNWHNVALLDTTQSQCDSREWRDTTDPTASGHSVSTTGCPVNARHPLIGGDNGDGTGPESQNIGLDGVLTGGAGASFGGLIHTTTFDVDPGTGKGRVLIVLADSTEAGGDSNVYLWGLSGQAGVPQGPIPAPGVPALLTLGLAAVANARRRRR